MQPFRLVICYSYLVLGTGRTASFIVRRYSHCLSLWR
jgi:hypothetical protein